MIQGLTGQLDMWRNRAPFRKNFPELADDLFADGDAPAAILVYVDCWTSLGGSQFLDSPGTGKYHTYLCDEVVPWVDERYRTLPAAEHRGIAGKSSGGYGAMVTPMLRPDVFGGLATHAGDALFEACYLPEMPQTARSSTRRVRRLLRALLGGLPLAAGLLEGLRPRAPQPVVHGGLLLDRRGRDGPAALRPRDGGAHPRRLGALARLGSRADGPGHADALRSLKAIYIDAGKKDEWFLDLGAEAFRRALEEIGVTDVYFELFDATHMAIEYRYPLGIRYLAERLSP